MAKSGSPDHSMELSTKARAGAARAVIEYYNPGGRSSRNGWGFFRVSETSRFIQSIR